MFNVEESFSTQKIHLDRVRHSRVERVEELKGILDVFITNL